MLKLIRITAAAAAAAFVLCGIVHTRKDEDRRDCVRLHIIANSDGEADQQVKLKVRDAILKIARERLSASDACEAENGMILLGNELESEAERVLRENGMDYGASLYLGEFDFPDRTYGDEVYPAGKYRALRVVLGDGAGQNWWCVVFPPLCLVTDEPEFTDDGALKFRSFFAELWRGLFG